MLNAYDQHVCIQEAECEKARMDSRYEADTKIADSKRMYEMQKANFDMEVNARVSNHPWFMLNLSAQN